jgi:glutamine amidotransferase
MEELIPDHVYSHRLGTGDTEAIFLAALADGLDEDPAGAVACTLARVQALMLRTGSRHALCFAAAHSDGHTLTCFRWPSDTKPPSLYWRERNGNVIVVSEPLDARRADWRPIAPNHLLVARRDVAVEVRAFDAQ